MYFLHRCTSHSMLIAINVYLCNCIYGVWYTLAMKVALLSAHVLQYDFLC